MKKTMLTQSGAPEYVIGWSDSHGNLPTVVNIVFWICHFLMHYWFCVDLDVSFWFSGFFGCWPRQSSFWLLMKCFAPVFWCHFECKGWSTTFVFGKGYIGSTLLMMNLILPFKLCEIVTMLDLEIISFTTLGLSDYTKWHKVFNYLEKRPLLT